MSTLQTRSADSAAHQHLYDVFLSHQSGDKPLVESIAARLVDERGLRPFLDKWHLIPGEPWQEALEEALDRSKTCVVFLGPGGLGTWENEEMRAALDERVRNKSFRVIPVLLPGAEPKDEKTLPRFLRRLTWVDFRGGLDDPDSFQRLVAGIRGVAPGRKSAQTTSSVMPARTAGRTRRRLWDFFSSIFAGEGKSCIQSGGDVTISEGRLHIALVIAALAVVVIIALAAFYFASRAVPVQPQLAPSPTVEEATYLRGQVEDADGQPISSATVKIDEITGKPPMQTTTTSSGGFIIDKIPARIGDRVRVYVSKEGYVTLEGEEKLDQYVTLPGPLPAVKLRRKK